MNNEKSAEAAAQRRLEILSPLLAPGLDRGKLQALKRQIAEISGFNERTIRRWLKAYDSAGIGGLKTKSRGRRRGQSIPENVLAEAIIVRREVPSRSVAQIIDILESEGFVAPGVIKRSTLQDYFSAKGFSSRQMRLYESVDGRATRRFQHRNRNDLWQSDIKYGPFLPVGKGGKPQQCYLVTFIDDATRSIIHAEFYASQNQFIVEEAFRSAIVKWGAPKNVYFDNGKQYRNKWMRGCCQRLAIRLVYARPYAAASKGKVEKFNRLVDNYLAEQRLEKVKTLAELNETFTAWLSECYQNKPHSALKNAATPQAAYQSDKTPLRFIKPAELNEAFLHHEERKVDKSGCISLEGRKYDVGWEALGKKVMISFDPQDRSEIRVSWETKVWTAKELQIGTHCTQKPRLPESLTPLRPEESRVLKSARKKYEKRKEARRNAISFADIQEAQDV